MQGITDFRDNGKPHIPAQGRVARRRAKKVAMAALEAGIGTVTASGVVASDHGWSHVRSGPGNSIP
jgi:hypothetical protein